MERLVRRGPLSSWRLIPTRPPLALAIASRSDLNWSKAEGARIVMTGGAGFAASGAAGTRARWPDSRLSGAIGGTLTFELA